MTKQQFFLGCAVWGYKDWVDNFFPSGSRSRQFLSLYSRRLTTVEGNTTFYAVPDRDTVQRWADETPPGFQFCLKLPRTITHEGLLTPAIPKAMQFLDQMAALSHGSANERRLGPLFAQLPPGYGPQYWDDLATFLKAWPFERAELALEVRHLDWFRMPHRDRLNQLLSHLGVGRVLLDTRPIYQGPDDPQATSNRRKPKVPLQPGVTAPFCLIRFISHPTLERNELYLAEWVQHIAQWLPQGTRIYFFAHCPDEARSPHLARHFQALLEQQGVAVPPLPWNTLNEPQEASLEQLSLF
jgi:uncharacterized protein YecE (DUF72 family)